ncbi:hypothetical protein [Agrobacterium leguminum]
MTTEKKQSYISPILTRGDDQYFDENLFRTLKILNYALLALCMAIYYIPGLHVYLQESVFFTDYNWLPASFTKNIYQQLELKTAGNGLRFFLINALLQVSTFFIGIFILITFKRFHGTRPKQTDIRQSAVIPLFIVLLYMMFDFIFATDISGNEDKDIAYTVLNSPLIIVVTVGFYYGVQELLVQIFSFFFFFMLKRG